MAIYPVGTVVRRQRPTSLVIGPSSIEAIGAAIRTVSASAPASATFQTANAAVFYPVVLTEPMIVKRVWWYNGATASGNVDCGVYDAAGNRLTSAGTTAQSGTNALQVVDVTDVRLSPQVPYYVGLACDNTSATFFAQTITAITGSAQLSAVGMFYAASAFVLPNPVTFAAMSTGSTTRVHRYGIAFTDDF